MLCWVVEGVFLDLVFGRRRDFGPVGRSIVMGFVELGLGNFGL